MPSYRSTRRVSQSNFLLFLFDCLWSEGREGDKHRRRQRLGAKARFVAPSQVVCMGFHSRLPLDQTGTVQVVSIVNDPSSMMKHGRMTM